MDHVDRTPQPVRIITVALRRPCLGCKRTISRRIRAQRPAGANVLTVVCPWCDYQHDIELPTKPEDRK